jgi:hypothetical protein
VIYRYVTSRLSAPIIYYLKHWPQTLAVLALCFAPGRLSADPVLYSNLGPGNSFGGGAYSTGSFNGTTFITTAGGNLATVSVDIFANQFAPAVISVALYTDSSGLPGIPLETWTATFPSAEGTPPLTTLISLQHPLLTTDTRYWFVALPASVGVNWFWNNQGVNGGLWVGTTLDGISQGFPDSPTPAIQLTAVPEPISANLLLLGCVALLAMHIARKREWLLISEDNPRKEPVRVH